MGIYHRSMPAVTALLVGLTTSLLVLPQSVFAATKPADPALTMQEAMQKVEATFAIPLTYQLNSESYDTTWNQTNQSVYSFNFVQQGNVNGSQNSINVTVDANSGVTLNYDRYSGNSQKFVFPVPVSAKQAQALAIEWAKKLYPAQYPSVHLEPRMAQQGSLLQSTSYSFNFERMVHGIPAPFNGLTITIDGNGHLTSASETWSSMSFPSGSATISDVQANEIYRKTLGLHLEYTQQWHQDGTTSLNLMYESNNQNQPDWFCFIVHVNDQFTLFPGD